MVCALDTNKVIEQGQVWRLLTHAFCHDRHNILHIVFNMLFLFWFGRTLESMYGSREFLLFYLTAAICAALAYVALDLYTGSPIPAVGASGAVMAVVMLYTMHFPTEEIYICFIIPIQMRWLMVIFVIWDLHPVLLALAGSRNSRESVMQRTLAGWHSDFSTLVINGASKRLENIFRG